MRKFAHIDIRGLLLKFYHDSKFIFSKRYNENINLFFRIEYYFSDLLTMNYLDMLPLELLHEIAGDSEPAYKTLICAYSRFARDVSPGKRLDYMVGFGHNVLVSKKCTRWIRNGILHRKGGPAIIKTDDTKEWYCNGVIHRDNGPAMKYANGTKLWYRSGQPHREDGPAIFYCNGTIKWYRNGVPHRDDGPALIFPNGTQVWYRDGKIHRDDGPALICMNGSEIWYREGVQI